MCPGTAGAPPPPSGQGRAPAFPSACFRTRCLYYEAGVHAVPPASVPWSPVQSASLSSPPLPGQRAAPLLPFNAHAHLASRPCLSNTLAGKAVSSPVPTPGLRGHGSSVISHRPKVTQRCLGKRSGAQGPRAPAAPPPASCPLRSLTGLLVFVKLAEWPGHRAAWRRRSNLRTRGCPRPPAPGASGPLCHPHPETLGSSALPGRGGTELLFLLFALLAVVRALTSDSPSAWGTLTDAQNGSALGTAHRHARPRPSRSESRFPADPGDAG